MENGQEGAFACPDNGTESFTTWQGQKGLTKREHFAGLAMQGLLANPDYTDEKLRVTIYAVELADELLKQLEK